MKRLFLTIAMMVGCSSFLLAQSFTNEKLYVSVDAGIGTLLGKSNISSFGVGYRKDFNSGFAANIRANYLLNKGLQVGLKFNIFQASENLSSELGTIPEDVDLYYIAPQLGLCHKINEKWTFETMAGFGYMHYGSQSKVDDVERECSRGLLGSNFDLTITRHLFKHIHLGAGISLMGGQTSKLNEKMGGVNETIKLEKSDKIKLLRTDFVISVRCML